MAKTLAEGRKKAVNTKTYATGRKRHENVLTIQTGRSRITSMNGKPSKTLNILNHLKKHGTITSWEAITLYRATRLSGIIWQLKKQGYVIVTYTKSGRDYATYKLVA
jgi:hypothetical protein|tara:strand:- start:6269 stop:6589 length:321 start_codon:yes stop_codon:yes gene_type:complete